VYNACQRRQPTYPPSFCQNLSATAFLLDQSTAYIAAFALSSCEFWLGYVFLGEYKRMLCGLAGGLVLSCAVAVMWTGQLTRSVGMATAGFAFTHQVQSHRRKGHELVTWGIYSVLRHPGYTGWFYASIATQFLLCNPLCIVLYTLAAWRFFAHRIPHEEYRLYTMFGKDYLSFQKTSWVLIPFIPSPLDVLHKVE